MDLKPLEYSKDCIGVFLCKPFRLLQGVGLYHDKTSRMIRKWAGQNYSTSGMEYLNSFEVRCPMNFPFRLAIRTIKAQNHKRRQHGNWRFTIVFPILADSYCRLLQWDSIFVTQAEFVPPADFRFAQFPA